MSWLHLVLRFDDLLSCHPSLPGHYPFASLRSPLRGSQWLAISLGSARRYYDGSDCCQPSRDIPALTALLCSRHHPCLAYDHQPPQHSPRQVPYLPSRTGTRTHQGFAIDEQARRSVVAESCSLSLSSVRFFSLLSTPPRGDAVTSSSHQEHGSRWPGSPTPEDCDASQRTRPHSPSEVLGGTTKELWPQRNTTERKTQNLLCVPCDLLRLKGLESGLGLFDAFRQQQTPTAGSMPPPTAQVQSGTAEIDWDAERRVTDLPSAVEVGADAAAPYPFHQPSAISHQRPCLPSPETKASPRDQGERGPIQTRVTARLELGLRRSNRRTFRIR